MRELQEQTAACAHWEAHHEGGRGATGSPTHQQQHRGRGEEHGEDKENGREDLEVVACLQGVDGTDNSNESLYAGEEMRWA